MRVRFSLSLKFFLLFGLILIVTIGVSTFFITRLVANSIREQVEWRGISLAKFLASQAAEALLQQDDLTLVSVTTGLKRSNPGVIKAVVIDNRGLLVSHSDSILLKDKPYRLRDIRVYKVIEDRLANKDITVKLFESGNAIGVEIPMIDRIRGENLGKVFVLLSREVIDQAARKTSSFLLLVGILAIAGGLLASLLFSRIITRNIEVLIEDLEEIGRGNLEHEVRVRSNDEIGLIADAIRSMTRQLKQAQEKLIESERLKHEVEVARRIQSILLPKSMPHMPGYEFAAAYYPALVVGGDYYDYFRMLGGQWGFLVADVSGKGVGGSLVMVMFRTIIHSEAPISSSPKELILKAHESIAGEIPDDMYITCAMMALHPSKATATLVSAGHNPPLYYCAREDEATYVELEGAPIGLSLLDKSVLAEILEERTLTLGGGDVIMLYSDGITEATNAEGEQFGERRLRETFLRLVREGRSAEGIKDGILDTLKDFTKGAPQSDDITLLIVKKVGGEHR
ncbi:MAG: SpoIIE family protein phosphatase [Thermotogae bacterium]|nr:SpoIIE family protein phosphatase [Thermotogota bacterium]